MEYLYRELNPNGQNAHIARLTGSTSHDAERIVKRFSPTWNLGVHESLPSPEIRMLLATDIVSGSLLVTLCQLVVIKVSSPHS